GEAWSEYMIRTCKAQIVWIGRREKEPAIQAKMDALAALGPAPHYISADAGDLKSLQNACAEISRRYSQVNGIIHSAIVLADKSLANMTEERFRSALSAKVDASVRLAQVFNKEPLDFVLFFSSAQSFENAPGQSNYAAGCAFKDAFALRLSREWPCAVKTMNWGYWGTIGIVASAEHRERMAREGVGSIEPPEAMEALEKLLKGPLDQLALIKTAKPMDDEQNRPHDSIAIYPETYTSILSALNQSPDYSPEK
ncbi:MAG: SDR family NAD(P)-dependent oxidoreductase, partial [Gammaproteobacteria bacterium]|nr:SDR family NAD(P)-dependent oxidoreductase [Gammaproteobacteria bacterium]